MYSFSKERRFKISRPPICDRFYNVSDTKSKRAASIGYGKRSENMGLRQESPPPGSYNLKSDFVRQPKAHAFSFGMSREYFQKVYLKENPPVDISVPGPGQYKVNTEYTYHSGEKYSLRPRTAAFSSFNNSSSRAFPGPGTYDMELVGMNNIEHCMVSKFKKYGAPVISRQGKRFNNDYLKRSREVPGPGQYKSQASVDPLGNYTSSKWKSSGAPVFSKASRKVDLETSQTRKITPGPGTYRCPTDFGFIKEDDQVQLQSRSFNSSRRASMNRSFVNYQQQQQQTQQQHQQNAKH